MLVSVLSPLCRYHFILYSEPLMDLNTLIMSILKMGKLRPRRRDKSVAS